MQLTQEICQETFQHMYYVNKTRNINLRHEMHALTMNDLLKLRSADISIMLQSLYLIFNDKNNNLKSWHHFHLLHFRHQKNLL